MNHHRDRPGVVMPFDHVTKRYGSGTEVDALYTNDLIRAINDFDAASVRKQA